MGRAAGSQAVPGLEDRMRVEMVAYMRVGGGQDPGELMSVSFEEDRIVSPMNEYEVLQLLMQDAREIKSLWIESKTSFRLPKTVLKFMYDFSYIC